jgi:hypothetical protein
MRKGKTPFSFLQTFIFLSLLSSTATTTIVDLRVAAAAAAEVHSLSSSSTTRRRRHINHNDVYLIITDPRNKLSQSVANQLYPATVYFVCPTTTAAAAAAASEEKSSTPGTTITKHFNGYFGGFLHQQNFIKSLRFLHCWFQSLFALATRNATTKKRLRSRSSSNNVNNDAQEQRGTTTVRFCYVDSYDGSSFQETRKSMLKCLHSIEENCTDQVENTTTTTRSSKMTLRGILFNPYGFPTTTTTTTTTTKRSSSTTEQQVDLLPLARYKVISVAIFIDVILQQRLRRRREQQQQQHNDKNYVLQYSSRLRMIAVGSEAARGLPKMGFPIPYKLSLGDHHDGSVGDTKQRKESTVITDILSGKAFQNNNNNNDDGEDEPLSTSSTTKTKTTTWESEYSHICAIAVLYFKRLAALSESSTKTWIDRLYGDDYYGVVSPGMTQESLQVRHVPIGGRTVFFRIKMVLCRTVLFGWLRKLEIAKTIDDGAALLVDALLGQQEDHEPKPSNPTDTEEEATEKNSDDEADDDNTVCWPYPNGAFVGARSGTGGPICEQTELKGGGVLLSDETLQEVTYDVVQRYIRQDNE